MRPTPSLVTHGCTTIYVADLERAFRFYCGTLDLRAVNWSHQCALVMAGKGLDLLLHFERPGSPAAGTHGAISVGLKVAGSLEQTMNTLRERGVTFRGEITSEGEARVAYFRDPDGNELHLFEGWH